MSENILRTGTDFVQRDEVLTQNKPLKLYIDFTPEERKKGQNSRSERKILQAQLTAYERKKCKNCRLPCPLKLENLNKNFHQHCLLTPQQVYLLEITTDTKNLKETILGNLALLQGSVRTFKERGEVIKLLLAFKESYHKEIPNIIDEGGFKDFMNKILLKVIEKNKTINVVPDEVQQDEAKASSPEGDNTIEMMQPIDLSLYNDNTLSNELIQDEAKASSLGSNNAVPNGTAIKEVEVSTHDINIYKADAIKEIEQEEVK